MKIQAMLFRICSIQFIYFIVIKDFLCYPSNKWRSWKLSTSDAFWQHLPHPFLPIMMSYRLGYGSLWSGIGLAKIELYFVVSARLAFYLKFSVSLSICLENVKFGQVFMTFLHVRKVTFTVSPPKTWKPKLSFVFKQTFSTKSSFNPTEMVW